MKVQGFRKFTENVSLGSNVQINLSNRYSYRQLGTNMNHKISKKANNKFIKAKQSKIAQKYCSRIVRKIVLQEFIKKTQVQLKEQIIRENDKKNSTTYIQPPVIEQNNKAKDFPVPYSTSTLTQSTFDLYSEKIQVEKNEQNPQILGQYNKLRRSILIIQQQISSIKNQIQNILNENSQKNEVN